MKTPASAASREGTCQRNPAKEHRKPRRMQSPATADQSDLREILDNVAIAMFVGAFAAVASFLVLIFFRG
jgi:hypothetical protein